MGGLSWLPQMVRVCGNVAAGGFTHYAPASRQVSFSVVGDLSRLEIY